MNNQYGSALADPDTPTRICSLVIPERGGYSLVGLRGWAFCDSEWSLYLNGLQISGGCTTAGSPNLDVSFAASPYGLRALDVLLLYGRHNESSPYLLHANLFYELL